MGPGVAWPASPPAQAVRHCAACLKDSGRVFGPPADYQLGGGVSLSTRRGCGCRYLPSSFRELSWEKKAEPLKPPLEWEESPAPAGSPQA